jgi:hypothetical protein
MRFVLNWSSAVQNCGTDLHGFAVPFAVSTTLLTVLAPLLIAVSG